MILGLKALHDLKICHRDIKSANIFINNKGEIKLGDFNVSKVAKKGMLYTQTGTPYYASPEVWRDRPYDYKSDLWSIGCVLYEMIMLRPPFKSTDMKGLYKKITSVDYPPILTTKYSSDLAGLIKLIL
jgi:NIMA (never in mitosis gene a)-related kinase